MEVKRTLWQEELARGLPTQRLAWFGVVMEGDGIELLLGVDTQIRALGQHPAQQAIGVLVDPPCSGKFRGFRRTTPAKKKKGGRSQQEYLRERKEKMAGYGRIWKRGRRSRQDYGSINLQKRG